MDRREKIIRDFSRWAAASAARQGSDIRGRKWYEHIEKIKLDKLLAVEFDCLPEKFGEWHREEVETLAKESGSVIGWAAKIVNMVTKVQIHIAQRGNQGVLKLIHPPIDNQLIDAIKKKYPKNGFNAHNNFRVEAALRQWQAN